jgi:hypothetical protein
LGEQALVEHSDYYCNFTDNVFSIVFSKYRIGSVYLPAFLNYMNNAWKKWMSLAKKFGNVQANVLLSVVYCLIIAPLGFLFKLLGKFQTYNAKNSSYWLLRKKVKQDISWARKQ